MTPHNKNLNYFTNDFSKKKVYGCVWYMVNVYGLNKKQTTIVMIRTKRITFFMKTLFETGI